MSMKERFEELIDNGRLLALSPKALEELVFRGEEVRVEVKDCSLAILSFIEAECKLAEEVLKEKLRAEIDKWDKTNGPQIDPESGRQVYYKDWIIRLLSHPHS